MEIKIRMYHLFLAEGMYSLGQSHTISDKSGKTFREVNFLMFLPIECLWRWSSLK
jgi:hypothetical protein